MDVVAPKGENVHLALGAEYRFGWRKLSVDYAFVSHGDLDPIQVMSIGIDFLGCAD